MIDIKDEPKGKFWSVLHEARPGENIVYSRGPFCTGRHRHDAMDAYNRGLVTLVQKRNGYADFSYVAQKLNPKKANKK